ncbi:UNKNOWN [Stylonychia lemnae]|uniref:Uncharacterized protein n=1 Tax=Stylonychia lemnae TaxID=5949 RepID=A0A078AAP8_STYLE|nr:UNKNOWN [Stylonychia lemnae]|eukprot:CDW79289.1 UNKNOWN [Stylonychia lemnae]
MSKVRQEPSGQLELIEDEQNQLTGWDPLETESPERNSSNNYLIANNDSIVNRNYQNNSQENKITSSRKTVKQVINNLMRESETTTSSTLNNNNALINDPNAHQDIPSSIIRVDIREQSKMEEKPHEIAIQTDDLGGLSSFELECLRESEINEYDYKMYLHHSHDLPKRTQINTKIVNIMPDNQQNNINNNTSRIDIQVSGFQQQKVLKLSKHSELYQHLQSVRRKQNKSTNSQAIKINRIVPHLNTNFDYNNHTFHTNNGTLLKTIITQKSGSISSRRIDEILTESSIQFPNIQNLLKQNKYYSKAKSNRVVNQEINSSMLSMNDFTTSQRETFKFKRKKKTRLNDSIYVNKNSLHPVDKTNQLNTIYKTQNNQETKAQLPQSTLDQTGLQAQILSQNVLKLPPRLQNLSQLLHMIPQISQSLTDQQKYQLNQNQEAQANIINVRNLPSIPQVKSLERGNSKLYTSDQIKELSQSLERSHQISNRFQQKNRSNSNNTPMNYLDKYQSIYKNEETANQASKISNKKRVDFKIDQLNKENKKILRDNRKILERSFDYEQNESPGRGQQVHNQMQNKGIRNFFSQLATINKPNMLNTSNQNFLNVNIGGKYKNPNQIGIIHHQSKSLIYDNQNNATFNHNSTILNDYSSYDSNLINRRKLY